MRGNPWTRGARSYGAFTLLLLLACDPEPVVAPSVEEIRSQSVEFEPPGQVRGSTDLLVTTGLTVDENGTTVVPAIADPSTLLYYRRTGLPVLAPDGSHVTAGQFSAVRGSVAVSCLPTGTLVRMSLRNLIPGATYRIWLLKFKEPGFSLGPPPDFSNLTGEGALGPNDRSRNTFVASASGRGQISRLHRAGPLSETLPEPPFANEPAGQCLLTDEFEFHLVGAFQQPGQPSGPDVGPPAFFPESAVEQFTFNFRNQ